MPGKICPKCNIAVNIRKLSCVCGYVFVLRRTQRVSVKTRKLEKLEKRALEACDDVLRRREQVKNRVAHTRAKETENEKASQRMSDKAHKKASRAKETEQEKASQRMSDKAHKTAI